MQEKKLKPKCKLDRYEEGSLVCYIRDIDYSYTDIDIKQLYAQVFEEAKE